MLHINQRDKKENAMQHLRILILTALIFSIFFIAPAQAQQTPLDDECSAERNAFWLLTYQDKNPPHEENTIRKCAVRDGVKEKILSNRIDDIYSNNDPISLYVQPRTGYQMTFFSETNFGGERLVFTDSRTETNPFEVFSYIVEPLQAVLPAQAQRGPNSLDDCASHTIAFWSLTYQGTEESHDSNSMRMCAVVDSELGNIPRVDRISSNNDLISLSVELRTGYQVTFFSETNFGGERLVFTDSRTETNPFEVFSYTVEPLQAVPTTLALSHEVITAGSAHTCVVRADHRVVCWGDNNYGQTNVPASVQGETVQIAVGSYYTCALRADRRVVCWGNNSHGQTSVPDSVQGEAVQIATANSSHACALRADHRVVCWGHGRSTIVPDSVQGEAVQIDSGYWHNCALQADHTVVCWGYNNRGELNVPDSIQGETVQIAAGYGYTCALRADRRVVCWGWNHYGQATVPASIQGETVQIVVGSHHTCAVQVDRRVVCWGDNRLGQTSVPDSIQRESMQIDAGWHHTCAVQVDHKVVCWGLNGNGQTTVPEGLHVAS